MLSKRVCRKCRDSRPHIGNWTEKDEMRWKNGWLICPMPFVKLQRPVKTVEFAISGSPPLECSYILEHLLATQMETQNGKTPDVIGNGFEVARD